jgi:hypothetical protein
MTELDLENFLVLNIGQSLFGLVGPELLSVGMRVSGPQQVRLKFEFSEAGEAADETVEEVLFSLDAYLGGAWECVPEVQYEAASDPFAGGYRPVFLARR